MSAASKSAILRHIPSEILEEILLKLPVKSLARISTVSKSWLFMISESGFIQEHKRRAAVNGVKSIVTVPLYDHLDSNISVCRIPHTSSMGIDDSTPLICPIKGIRRRLRAFCDGLLLVDVENFRFDEPENFRSVFASSRCLHAWELMLLRDIEKSLYLWNPSTRTHRKLPDSLTRRRGEFVYGLGYDSAADDYKVLKIAREKSSSIPTELYSLKSDSWKTISPPPGIVREQERCEYVNGSFHWIRTLRNRIVSFDLSTEKCREIVFPATALESDYSWTDAEVVVMTGKLCVSVNNVSPIPDGFRFALWVMEEYGIEKSWTKVLNIVYGAEDGSLYDCLIFGSLSPLYLYDNGDILFNTSDDGLYMYIKEGTLFRGIVDRSKRMIDRRGFTYVESLDSPLLRSRH